MPQATAKLDSFETHDLESCPGGFVKLRRMTYGEKLQRRQMSMDMEMTGQGKSQTMKLDMAAEKVALFEFGRLIVEHNLEDETGRVLNFNNPADMVRLDPQVGDEIEILIQKMNDFDAEGN